MSARRVLRTGGLWFDGRDDHVVLPPIPFTGEITIVAWIYDKNVYTYYWGTVFGWHCDESNYFVLNHYSNTGYQKFEFKLNNILRKAQTTIVIPSRWLCVAGVFSASQGFVRLYWDGSLVAQTTFTPFSQQTLTPVRNYIGRYETGHWFEGYIDGFRIYNRALSMDEIKAIYERDEFIKDGLVLYLDFSEYGGNIVYDKSGMGNHGTIYGGARWVIKKALRVLPKAR